MRTLQVLPNPWLSLDRDGRPMGACPKERVPTTLGHQGYVGATMQVGAIEKLPQGHAGTPHQETSWLFSVEPTTVEDTNYYRAAIRGGDLIAADQATAATVGVPWVAREAAWKAAKAAAVARWRAAFGEVPSDFDPFAGALKAPAQDSKPPKEAR